MKHQQLELGQEELRAARRRSRGLYWFVGIFSFFANLLMLTGPLFMLQVYDRVLGSRSVETLVALFALVAVLYFFYWLLEYARGRVMARAGARLQSAMNTPVFNAILERAALRRGTTRGSLQDLEAVRNLFSSPVLLALFDLPWTPVFLVAIFIFHPLLGWLAVAGGGLLIVVAILNQLLTTKKTAEGARLSMAASQFSRQAEEGGDVIRAQGMGPAMTGRWLQLNEQAVEQSLRANDWTGSFSSFSKAFRFFLQSAMLALGAWLVLQPSAEVAGETVVLGQAQLSMLLEGIDWRAPERRWQPAAAG